MGALFRNECQRGKQVEITDSRKENAEVLLETPGIVHGVR